MKVAPKLEKSPGHYHNLTSSEGGQDTVAYHISGHSLHAFSRKYPETPNLTPFTKSKQCQNYKNQQTMTMNYSVLKVVKLHLFAKFQAIPSMRSPGNDRKPQIWPVSLSQNSAKITKINRLWPWTDQFWRWSRYTSVQNFRPFPPCVHQEMPGNPKFDPFH